MKSVKGIQKVIITILMITIGVHAYDACLDTSVGRVKFNVPDIHERNADAWFGGYVAGQWFWSSLLILGIDCDENDYCDPGFVNANLGDAVSYYCQGNACDPGVDQYYPGSSNTPGANITLEQCPVPSSSSQANSSSTGSGVSIWDKVGNDAVYTKGWVGINTNSPQTNLHVNGNILAENGVIEANSIKVSESVVISDWTIKTPDYVFAEDYKLSPLQDVEKYIDKHSHLPDVPSAKNLEKTGMNVAEMNLILLKKIEELTLYAIEQNKRIEALEEKLQQQAP